MTDIFDPVPQSTPASSTPTNGGLGGLPPSQPPKKGFIEMIKKPWVLILMAVALAVIVLGFSVNRIMIALLHSRPEVVVPKLEGKSLMEAMAIVSPLDLSLQQEGAEFDETLPAGTVLRQAPPSGMQVRSGRAIRVVLSKGGQVVFVPDVVGKPLQEAQSLLATDGMQMGAVTELYSSDIPKNTVVSQSPPPQTVVTRGALVDVNISKGLPPAGLPLVPDFTGKKPDDVRSWAKDVQADVRVREDIKAFGIPGTVFKQDPAPGQPLLEGQEVLVSIVSPSAAAGVRLTYKVPGGDDGQTVRIMARDDKGETRVYEGKHDAGADITIPVRVTSTTRFRIYVDDVLKDEKVIEGR